MKLCLISPNAQKLQRANFLLFTILLFLVTTCNSVEPPSGLEINLKLEDVSCTEAWITLSTTNFRLPTSITLKQNSQVIKTINLTKPDSLFYLDSLLPNTSYQYQASNSQYQVTSNQIQLTTLDTTSHNFTFTSYQFGEHSSSTLYDVAIIDENNIWAVGEIYMNDSLGQHDPNAYNALHWDGNDWKLMKIMFYTICGQQSRSSYPASSIFAFSESDIWIADYGDQVTKLNGTAQVATYCLPISFSIFKLWGDNPNSLYMVGDMGKIVHYQNGNWSEIASGTTTNINDIWGVNNSVNNENLILSTVSSRFQTGDYKLLSISSGTVSSFNWGFERLYGVWFNSGRAIYVVGDDIHIYKNNRWETLNLTDYFLTRVKGTTLNNIFVAGCCNILFHFNGVSWKEMEGINGEFEGLDVKGNIIISVGWENSKAIILMGKRIN
jgi:hypothetical protein